MMDMIKICRTTGMILFVSVGMIICNCPILDVRADERIPINAQTFPDSVFREYIVDNFDKNSDGYLSISERKTTNDYIYGMSINVQKINVQNKNIESLVGIEYFTDLVNLYCSQNKITELDLSNNIKLENLYCDRNNLTNLDISNNVYLSTLSCYGNQIDRIDVSECPCLRVASDANVNEKRSVDGRKFYSQQDNIDQDRQFDNGEDGMSNEYLNCMLCYDLDTEIINTKDNVQVVNIVNTFSDEFFRTYISDNRDKDGDGYLSLKEILSVTKLTNFPNGINDFEGLDVFPYLAELTFHRNQLLTDLDVSGCSRLTHLEFYGNQLKELDVSGCSRLTYLSCSDNQLAELDISGCPGLTYLYCSGNQLTELDISGCPGLTQLSCSDNQLTELNVSECSGLGILYCSGNQLTELDVSGCPSLISLYCSGNQLTELDVSRCPRLINIACDGNQLTELDISYLQSLGYLKCFLNRIDLLDISNNPYLKKAYETGYLNEESIEGYSYYSQGYYFGDTNYILEYDKNTRIVNEVQPSVTPSVTSAPIVSPTAATKVTVTPTCKPSATVTTKPIAKPTVKPTNKPTVSPKKVIRLNKSVSVVVCGSSDQLKATLTNSSSKVTWTSSDNKVVGVDSNGKITAKMAGSAVITATATGKKASCSVTVLYKDVTNAKDFWYAPTNYLTAKGVVKGYDKQTLFKPTNDCTRAQMLTFMWRLQGEPTPKASICKFPDVKKTDYFYKPVIWAVEKGITTGYSDGKFKPQNVCTRAQTVTFLWRMANKPAPKTKKNSFPDVKTKDYFYKATLWASEKKILAGLPDGTFNPQGKCLRRQMVTFLYKYDKYVNGKG